MSNRLSKTTIDHDEIRRWAEQRKGKPAIVRGTGIIRLDFPGFSGQEKLEHIAWDDWFDRFEESKLALVLQETTARGQKSNFNKLVGRETVDLETGAQRGPARRRAKQGARTTKEARRIRVTKGRAVTARPAAKRKARPAPKKARGAAPAPKKARGAAPAPKRRATTQKPLRRGGATSTRTRAKTGAGRGRGRGSRAGSRA